MQNEIDLSAPALYGRRVAAGVMGLLLWGPMAFAFVLAAWNNPGTGAEQLRSAVHLLVPLAALGIVSAALLSFAFVNRVLWWLLALGATPAVAQAWNIYQS